MSGVTHVLLGRLQSWKCIKGHGWNVSQAIKIKLNRERLNNRNRCFISREVFQMTNLLKLQWNFPLARLMPFPALVLLKLHWNEKNAIFVHGRVHGNESRFEVERLWMGMVGPCIHTMTAGIGSKRPLQPDCRRVLKMDWWMGMVGNFIFKLLISKC